MKDLYTKKLYRGLFFIHSVGLLQQHKQHKQRMTAPLRIDIIND